MKIKFNLCDLASVHLILDEDFYKKNQDEIFKVCYNGSAWTAYIIDKTVKINIARLIMNCPKNKVVDHINGNALDNRKINLRICTRQENSFNSKKRRNCSSKFKGVSKVCSQRSITKKWRARIRLNNKEIQLGVFNTEIGAALAYNKKALELFGKYAKLNEID